MIFYHSQSLNDSFYHDRPKKFYRQLYFETFDNINCIKDGFDQTGYEMYVHLQGILIKAFKEQDCEDDLQIVIQSYGVDEFYVPSFFQFLQFLLFLPETTKSYLDSRMQLSVVIALFKKLDTSKRMLVAEVIKLVKLIVSMPAINVVSERSF